MKKDHLLLFFISPISGLIYGLQTWNKKHIRWTIFFFTFIYGSVFHPSHLGDGKDHFESLLRNYSDVDFTSFISDSVNILSLNPTIYTNDDLYLHVVSYFVGSVISLPNLFFSVIALVFSFFYSGALVKLFSYVNFRSRHIGIFFLFFIILTLLWIHPGKMQSVRHGTAFWVLIYYILSYTQTKKIKFLFLSIFYSPSFSYRVFSTFHFIYWLLFCLKTIMFILSFF